MTAYSAGNPATPVRPESVGQAGSLDRTLGSQTDQPSLYFVGAATVLIRAFPIHYDDYTVYKSPLEDFRKEVQAAGVAERVRYLMRGETYLVDAAEE